MNKKILIGSIILLVLGTVAMLVGFGLTGWSIIDWLKSPYATTCFILVGIGIIVLVNILIIYRNGKRWKD